MPARYVSIDIEGTGLDPDTCQIIEFAAVVETVGSTTPVEELPSFHRYCVHDVYQGEPFALAMHPHIFRKLADVDWKNNKGRTQGSPEGFCPAAELGFQFKHWLYTLDFPKEYEKVRVRPAGKNFAAYDLHFLKKQAGWSKHIAMNGRVFDPGILYFDPLSDDDIPGTAECLARAGLEAEAAHTALGDARDVVRLLRAAWSGAFLAAMPGARLA